jgi:hypothetical protein
MRFRTALCCCCLLGGELACGSGATDDGNDGIASALPVCAVFADSGATLPTLSPKVTQGWPGWDNGAHVYVLDTATADGWTLSLESGSPPAVEAVSDPGNLLAGLQAGDRISVDGSVLCQSFSGCKQVDVIRNAADGTLIEASYFHDSAMEDFSALLGGVVSLEPVCRAAETDGCYPGAVVEQNQLRFAGNPVPIAAGAAGSIVIGGQTVRVAAGPLVTLSGGTSSRCTDAGAFFRGKQQFTLAR